MNFEQLQQQLNNGVQKSTYLLCGEDDWLRQQAEQAIIQTLIPESQRSFNVQQFDTVEEQQLCALCTSVPFGANKQVIVVRSGTWFAAKKNVGPEQSTERTGRSQKNHDNAAVLLKLIETMPDYTCLVFSCADKIDTRRKLYKNLHNADAVVDCPLLSVKDVGAYVQKEAHSWAKKIQPAALECITSSLFHGGKAAHSLLDNELEKIFLYTQDKTTIDRSDVEAVICPTPEGSVFPFLDAVGQRNAAIALKLLKNLSANHFHPLMLLSMLVKHFHQLYAVRVLNDSKANQQTIVQQLKLHPFQADKLLRQCRNFSVHQLEQGLVRLADLEFAMKTSQVPGVIGISTFIAAMCHPDIH